MVAGKLPLVPRYRQKVRFVPARTRPAGVGRRPALQPRVPPAPHRAARPGRRAASCGNLVGRVMSPAARPPQAAVGDVDGRGPRATATGRSSRRCTTAWSTACRAPTCSRSCSTPSPSPAPPDAWTTGARARADRELVVPTPSRDTSRSPYEQLRAAARRRRAPRARRSASSRDRRAASAPWPASCGRRRASSLNGPIGPHRRWNWARDHARRRQDGPQRRSAARSTTSCSPSLTRGFRDLLAVARRGGRRTAWCARSCRCRCARPGERGQSTTTGSRR